MSIPKLLLIAVAAALTCVLALAAARGLTSPRTLRSPPAVPLPVPTLVAAGISVVLGSLVPWWVAPALVDWVARSAPLPLIQQHPSDGWLAFAYAGGLIAVWAATPGAAVMGWLLLSPRRSSLQALLFAAVVWVGGTLGLLAGVSLASKSMELAFAGGPLMPDLRVDIADLVAMAVRAGLGGGFCGGSAAAVCVMAASSPRGLQAALWATTALPLVVAIVSAIATPPDVTSQLLFAIPVTVVWMVGLGLGAGLQAVRAKMS